MISLEFSLFAQYCQLKTELFSSISKFSPQLNINLINHVFNILHLLFFLYRLLCISVYCLELIVKEKGLNNVKQAL